MAKLSVKLTINRFWFKIMIPLWLIQHKLGFKPWVHKFCYKAELVNGDN